MDKTERNDAPEPEHERDFGAEALFYHEHPVSGKLEIHPTKPLTSQYDLSLAYSPGVAEPCRAIAKNPAESYRYTARGNLVAVITNGTAVLGLGNIGPVAAKPVMEGKAVLFKQFGGIDVFDLELDCNDPDRFVEVVKALEPTFGGINLEDIRAPECFDIERRLREECTIPVMHDDQHGTAIIAGAALLNAVEVAGKRMEDLRIVALGAGAAGIACLGFFLTLGVRSENILLFDKDGVVSSNDTDSNDARFPFATTRVGLDLKAALSGADMLLGLSAGGIVEPEHLQGMASNPIVFALANPDPEISRELAVSARPDVIMATGRSDGPNQVNNVLGFPFIFRGALDVVADTINEEMKLAAAHAIAGLAREPVPDSVQRAYFQHGIEFGRDYLIPKPLDPRLLTSVAPAVARAAMESGAAHAAIDDWRVYESELLARVGIGQKLITAIQSQARRDPKRVVFAEADSYNVLKAAQLARDQGIAEPYLLGSEARILDLIEEHGLAGLADCTMIEPREEPELCEQYGELLYELRHRKGVTRYDAVKMMTDRNYFAAAMVEFGDADAMISGVTKEYPKVIRPVLHVIGPEKPGARVATMDVITSRRGTFFFADTAVNLDPNVEELVEIIELTARTVRLFDTEPVLAMLSYSNFGSVQGVEALRARDAVARAKERYPDIIIDGEVQANVALDQELLAENYPFSRLVGHDVNTLVFPNLGAGNIAYKLLGAIGGCEVLGPVLMGMNRPVQILQLGSSVREIFNMVALCVVEAGRRESPGKGT
ncbi:MAG: NADP-dependent malic enzyme [Spirochaeta sp.]|nr:NADP-dependent malic enzyme [Spirochaeta sp.]